MRRLEPLCEGRWGQSWCRGALSRHWRVRSIASWPTRVSAKCLVEHFRLWLRTKLDISACFSRCSMPRPHQFGGLGFWRRTWYAIRRMINLEDGQIMVASCIVAGRGNDPICVRHEANWYLAQLYGLYRWKHLRYAVRMLLKTVHVSPSGTMTFLCTLVLWIGVTLRWQWSRAVGGRLQVS